MNKNILEPDYENKFQDVYYPPPISTLLRGLASAIQDSHPTWRPKLSELVTLLPKSKESNRFVLAGSAYGAAKAIKDDFPGPAVLLFGAAVNAIGSAPQVELNKKIDSAEKKLKENNLYDDQNIKIVLDAAKQCARFDKVIEMLKQEFTNGLKMTGKYTDEKISEVVPKIVDITHDVRHKGLIDRFGWAVASSNGEIYSADPREIRNFSSSTDVAFLHEKGPIIFSKSFLYDLLPYAQEGCAHAILSRMEKRGQSILSRLG